MRNAAGIALVDPNGLLFLVRRNSQVSHGGLWSIPGGYVDNGESPLQAALRELKEESGLAVGGASQIGDLVVSTPEGGSFSVFVYQGSLPSRTPVMQKAEVDRWLWLEPALAFGLKLHPGMRKILDALERLV